MRGQEASFKVRVSAISAPFPVAYIVEDARSHSQNITVTLMLQYSSFAGPLPILHYLNLA